MNRPDEEREVVPTWIETKQSVSAVKLNDASRSISGALD